MRLKPGTERAWMCAFLDPRCGGRDLRKNHPGSPERTWRASGSVLYPWRGLHHQYARRLFGSDRGMAIGL